MTPKTFWLYNIFIQNVLVFLSSRPKTFWESDLAAMSPSIRDIAKKTGKSITTVSRALHDYDDVSSETKDLVRQVAAEMGYLPNTQAFHLRKQKSETIGLVLSTFGPRFSDPFFSEFLAGIGNKAALYGYDMLVSTCAPGPEEVRSYQTKTQSHRVDGFIIVRTHRNDQRINYLRQVNFPFVSFGRIEGELDFPFVDEDGEVGLRTLTSYLISLGHRRIGFIAPPSELTFSIHRTKGFLDCLKENGIEMDPALMCSGDLTQKDGYLQAQRLLQLDPPPTAIITCNDLMAFGCISAAQERGLIVGKDISITGFDNIPMAEHSHPPLTTVQQPIYQIGAMTCEMLIKILKGEELEQRQIILQPELIVRDSCGATRS